MSDSKNENHDSFSLNKKNRVGSQMVDGVETDPLSWQENAYERLKVLYKIGTHLSFFESIEITIPQILTLCSGAFPITTAVLIEKRGHKVKATAWHADGVSIEQTDRALSNCRRSFAYLTGASEADLKILMLDSTCSEKFVATEKGKSIENFSEKNFVVLPLTVDALPPFGVIQLEGSDQLGENDLEFMDSLTSLISVAIDRFYNAQYARETRARENSESSSKLGLSEAHVLDLQNQRELRERFVSLLSHDLRTPLSAVKISAQIIQRQPEATETSLTFAARIVSNVNRMDQMISDLLDANRIRSGEKLPLKLESFDLYTLIKKTIDELATVHGERFSLKSPVSIIGHWDSRSVRRIIENLCNNAVKYGAAEAPINLTISQTPNEISISVQNTGEIICPEDQKALFKQYHRSENAQGSNKKGWGIGLTLVRGVAEAHGGTANLTSDLDSGTTFTVRLPIDSRIYSQKEKI